MARSAEYMRRTVEGASSAGKLSTRRCTSARVTETTRSTTPEPPRQRSRSPGRGREDARNRPTTHAAFGWWPLIPTSPPRTIRRNRTIVAGTARSTRLLSIAERACDPQLVSFYAAPRYPRLPLSPVHGPTKASGRTPAPGVPHARSGSSERPDRRQRRGNAPQLRLRPWAPRWDESP